MMSNIWKRDFYKAPIPFIIDNQITEYDICKANISILCDANIIPESKYNELLNVPKMVREITIGKLQASNPQASKALSEGLSRARRKFLEMNNINDMNVIDIRKDSISVVGPQVMNLSISDKVKFRVSGVYSSFYRLNYIDLYYLFDVVTGLEKLDVKGLGEESKELHKDYMLDFLSELFYTAQMQGAQEALILLKNFNEKYINRELDIHYYRELNSNSMYRLSYSDFSSMYSDVLFNSNKKDLDISYNGNILRELVKYYSSVYFRKR